MDDSVRSQPNSGLRVSIPAQMESGTRAVDFGDGTGNVQATFATGEKVYVYNVTKSAMDEATLSPSASGQTVTLDGNLFGSYAVGDQLKLFYHAGATAFGSASEFSYTGQNGTQSSAAGKDFAVATVTVGSIENNELKTTSTALFENVQSFIRLTFDYKDWRGTVASPTITSLTISSACTSTATAFAPLTGAYTTGNIILNSEGMSNPVFVAIPFNESLSNSSDELTITATASSGIQYLGTKSAPSSGFKNGCYYYHSSTVTLTQPIIVGVISYLINDPGSDGYQLHYWGGSAGAQDVDLINTHETFSKDVGYWGSAQTFTKYYAVVPSDITGYKVHRGDRWFGNDADASQYSKAYIFNYDGDKAIYE